MADLQPILRQIYTDLVNTIRAAYVTIVDQSGAEISPATKDKQDDIITALESQSTAVKQDLIKAVLDDIKTATDAIQAAVEGTIDVELTGSSAEVESAQDTQVATTVETYNRAAGATMMELYVESGYVRIRTDGSPASAITGEPLGEGFAGCWSVSALSVYYVGDSTITVVSR